MLGFDLGRACEALNREASAPLTALALFVLIACIGAVAIAAGA